MKLIPGMAVSADGRYAGRLARYRPPAIELGFDRLLAFLFRC